MIPYIYTEIVNCGKVGKIALESFAKWYPTYPVHIYGTKEDFGWIPENSMFTLIDVSDWPEVMESYKLGHAGTAQLWARIILAVPKGPLVHFDSDEIGRAHV